MTSLEHLFRRQPGDAVQEQERISLWFPAALGESPLGVRVPHGPITVVGAHVVVGLMVAWSQYDRDIALGIERALAEGRCGTDTIEIFNGDDALTLQDLSQYIPDLGEEAAQNPWVGVWQDGKHWFSLGGASASAWLYNRYGIQAA
jgi:hypothetical protein